jgi:CRP-like cAMP-binding protein
MHLLPRTCRSPSHQAFNREGDFFSELSLLNGSPLPASVEAMTECRLFALGSEPIQELQRQFPELSRLLEERLAQYRRIPKREFPWIS